jgi:hypothetical protein
MSLTIGKRCADYLLTLLVHDKPGSSGYVFSSAVDFFIFAGPFQIFAGPFQDQYYLVERSSFDTSHC